MVSEHSKRRAIAYQDRQEAPGIVVMIIVAMIEFAIIGIMGAQSLYFGWGGAIAAFSFYSLGVFLYTRQNKRQSHTITIAVGLGASVIGLILNPIFLFGSTVYNFAVSGSFLGIVASAIYMFALLVLFGFGHYDVKHVDMS